MITPDVRGTKDKLRFSHCEILNHTPCKYKPRQRDSLNCY